MLTTTHKNLIRAAYRAAGVAPERITAQLAALDDIKECIDY